MDRQVRRAPHFLTTALLVLPAACGPDSAEVRQRVLEATPVVTAAVGAAAETSVPDNPTVDADDPLLWADPQDPSRALLIGTDKSIGLYVHDLAGRVLQFFPEGPLNNVDLRGGVPVRGARRVLVAAAERERFGIALFLLDEAALRLTRYGYLPTPRAFGEPYGFCMGQWAGETFLIANNKDGEILAFRVSEAADGAPAMTLAHRWKVASQTEGCVVDDRTGTLFVGEEDVGIRQMSLARPEVAPALLHRVDGRRLVADVEGLTIMRDGKASYLIASSQGDSAYSVYHLGSMPPAYVGRFRVAGGATDPVTQTDGLDAWSGPLGRFPEGALAVHDHCDGPGREDPPAAVCDSDGKQQNYKLIDWGVIRAALGLPAPQ